MVKSYFRHTAVRWASGLHICKFCMAPPYGPTQNSAGVTLLFSIPVQMAEQLGLSQNRTPVHPRWTATAPSVGLLHQCDDRRGGREEVPAARRFFRELRKCIDVPIGCKSRHPSWGSRCAATVPPVAHDADQCERYR